jgi:hypothetical protein
MALQPNTGPDLPFWGFVTITFLQGWIFNPAPTSNLEDQASVFMTPGDRVDQLYPQALGTHFSRLLRQAWVIFTVGLFFNPGHDTGTLIYYLLKIYFHARSQINFARMRLLALLRMYACSFPRNAL